MIPLYICDIDGTVANLEHRLHYIRSTSTDHIEQMEFRPDWEAFHANVIDDAPIYPIIEIINQLYVNNNDIWFFTGRMEHCRADTEEWLARYLFGNPNITMRPNGDYRPDYVIKQEMLDNMLQEDRDRLIAVFDDRERIVKMWRSNDIQCLQVKDGDY